MNIRPFEYSSTTTPEGYACSCGAIGVRLFREYQTFLEHQRLTCAACIEKETGRAISRYDESVNWKVAAVPTEDGSTFWGFLSIPKDGVEWWHRLPVHKPAPLEQQ